MSLVPEYDLAEENRRGRQLRVLVDLTCNVIAQGKLSRAEEERVRAARRRVLELFPGQGRDVRPHPGPSIRAAHRRVRAGGAGGETTAPPRLTLAALPSP
jgi:hypothetical protein